MSKISKALEERKDNSNEVPKSSLLARVLDKGENITEEIMGEFILSLLFAGTETITKIMSFIVHFLTGCPQALEQLRVINETLRLRGMATAVFRETTEDVKFNYYVIPKGWRVVPYLHAIHVNEEFYKDALSFNPWRWLEPDAENINWRNSEVFLPFGAGGRFCAGAELAMLEISLFLYYFVSKHSWDQLKEDRPSYFPMARMVNRFPIHVKERRQ
eukprot:PITA_15326